MTNPRFTFVPVLGHEMHVAMWGDRSNDPIIMWHGLARTGRDFDELAAALSDQYFVVCPDTIGRGLSSWSANPASDYTIDHYCETAAGLFDHFNFEKVGWIGTSMGGLIGMRLAAGEYADRLAYLIVNDIGPEIPQEAIDRILAYAGSDPEFASLQEAEAWFRAAYTPFGPASDAFWTRMVRTSVRRRDDGVWTTHYDPAITAQFTAPASNFTGWDWFENIKLPMRAIRGAESDILTEEIATRMEVSGPRVPVTSIPGCGHAPTLSSHDDATRVRNWITQLQAVTN